MLDINLFRNDLARVAAGLQARGAVVDISRFEALESRRKEIQTLTQDAQAKRNALSKQIGIAKGKGDDAAPLLSEVAGLGDELKSQESALQEVQTQLRDFLLDLPNLSHVRSSRNTVAGVAANALGATASSTTAANLANAEIISAS